MQRTTEASRAKSFLLIFLVFQSLYTLVNCATCNTAQNPSCAGVAQFEALCCPAPSVCYWANRDGAAACCPAGQNCNAAATGAVYSYYTTPAVVSQVVVYSSTSTTPTLTTHLTTTTIAGIVTVTTTAGFILIGTPSSPPTQTVVIKSGGTKFRITVLEAMVFAMCTTVWWLL